MNKVIKHLLLACALLARLQAAADTQARVIFRDEEDSYKFPYSFTVQGTLTVTGDAQIAGTTHLNDVIIAGDLSYDGLGDSDSLHISEEALIGGTLTVTGSTTHRSQFLSLGEMTVKNKLNVTKPVAFGSTLVVSGMSSLTGSANVTGNFGVSGNSLLSGTLKAGDSVLTNLTVPQNATIVGKGVVQTSLRVGNEYEVDYGEYDDLSAAPIMTVAGNASFNSDVEIEQNLFVDEDVTVHGNQVIDGRLTIGDDVLDTADYLDYEDDNVVLVVDGDAYFYYDVEIDENLYVGDDLYVSDDAEIENDFIVGGNTTLSGTLNVYGNTTLGNSLLDSTYIYGDATVQDDLTVGGDLTVGSVGSTTGDVTVGRDVSCYNLYIRGIGSTSELPTVFNDYHYVYWKSGDNRLYYLV